ncbi:MAG: UTP--glucose-1-phosphate uridylyltransferase [Roseivirga sp.]|nr:UTP--glucose-1-phosphate uridylyltransferase [Roseivirga sp.]
MVRKAIIPAAGLGTRMLPATKAVPKEMLTIVDKPVIQYVVEEAIDSGIAHILVITSKGKNSMRDHFSKDFPNAAYYREKGKTEVLERLETIGHCKIEFIEQSDLNGLGGAIYLGKDFIGDEPFAVLLGDTICDFEDRNPVLGQLIDVYNQFKSSVTAIEEVPADYVNRYGIMGGDALSDGIYKVSQWVEKPEPELAPSRLAIAARYVFTPAIFQCLEKTTKGRNNELQVTDAMHNLLNAEDMYGLQFKGTRFDVGNPLGFIKTNLHFGLKEAKMGEELRDWLGNETPGL